VTRAIKIVEVAPRDGLQNEKTQVSTADKISLIERAIHAGVTRMEVTSFVNPARVPQMADAEAVMAAIVPRFSHLGLIGLALNPRGAARALAAGCTEINYVVVASDSFALRNQGRSSQDLIAATAEVAALCKAARVPWSVSIAASFGCPFEGEVDPDHVLAITKTLLAEQPDEIAFADTIGCAVPRQVHDLIIRARKLAPTMKWRLHLHDTRNTAVANALAAIDAGVDVLDSSIGGTGGCPFAPGATGNVATEDLTWTLGRSGYQTSLDLDGLIATAKWLSTVLGKQVPAALTRAGPFPKPIEA
jgi:isopropylmalate/homocitrate/citramalate synthase